MSALLHKWLGVADGQEMTADQFDKYNRVTEEAISRTYKFVHEANPDDHPEYASIIQDFQEIRRIIEEYSDQPEVADTLVSNIQALMNLDQRVRLLSSIKAQVVEELEAGSLSLEELSPVGD